MPRSSPKSLKSHFNTFRGAKPEATQLGGGLHRHAPHVAWSLEMEVQGHQDQEPPDMRSAPSIAAKPHAKEPWQNCYTPSV